MDIVNTQIPLLRFSEYANESDIWDKKKIGKVIKAITPPKKLQSDEFRKSGKYPIIDQSQKFICGYSDDLSAVIDKDPHGFIVFGDHTCVLKYIDFPFIQGADGIKIFNSNEPNTIDNRYLFQFLKSFPIESKEYKRHFSDLKEKQLLFPKTVGEQRKIADCLFAIDSYISSINEKIEQLKAHKKSLMQKLFPQNGESVPKYRFPEFKQDDVWGAIPLKDIAEVFQGYGFPEKMQGKKEGKYPFIKVSDISSTVNKGNRFICTSANYIDENDLQLLKATPIPSGTIVFAKIGEAIRLRRRAILSRDSLIDNNVAGVKANNKKVNDDFLYYILLMTDFSKYAGGVVPAIKKSSLENMEILLPPTICETNKIAKVLSTFDKIIYAYIQMFLLLTEHKIGLVQQLFPKS